VAQGYLYNDTIINYTGISYGGDFATYIKVFEEGGVLKFWWPRISYWNSFNVNVMAMDGPTNNTITRNRVTAIGNSTEPTGTKKQQINLVTFLRSTGNAATATKATDLNQARYANTDFNTLGASPQVFRAYTNYIPSGGSYNQPTSAGDFKVLQWGDVEGGAGGNGNWGGQIVQNFYDDRMWFRRSYGTTWQAWREFIHDGNVGSFAMRTNASATNSVDVRAPIFYDSNNTGYYVDPNEVSKTWRMGANYFQNNDDVSADTPFGLYFANGLSSAYAIFREGGAWTHPYPDLRIAFHTGIKMGAAAGYGGMKFYTDYDMSSQVMSINNGADPLGAGNVYVNSNLQAGSSLRAQLFYDSNNTAYYVDPNSNSVLYKFENINQRVAYDRAWDNYPSITVYNTTDQGPQNDFRIHGIGGANGGDFAVRLLVDGDITSLANINAGGAFYGQGFYDSNNTGYYGDFSSTGTSLNVAGSIVAAGNVTAYSDRRLKNNIQQMTSALDKVSQLLGVTFTRNDLADTTRRYGGLLAQDVEKVLPEAVHDIGGTLGVDYNATIGLLVEAIKELRDEVEMLRK